MHWATSRAADEDDLKGAIAHDEFVVYFQHQIDLATGTVVGYEALVRRQLPHGNLVAPNEFIGLAERTGLIVPLGRLILEKACCQLTAIHRSLPSGARLPWVAVNFSTRQLDSAGVVDDIADVLNKTGLDPGLLWIEITETAITRDLERCAATLHEIRSLGVHLSIDDFGTGCSSLRHVKFFPIEQLKVDRSFTAGVGVSEADTSIVVSIISLAHSLGIHVVAEGIETAEQRARLVALGCDVGQGFYWSRPMPFEQAAAARCLVDGEANISPSAHKDLAYIYPRTGLHVHPSFRIAPALTAEALARLNQLSDRPREVVIRLIHGERVAGIAKAMYVSKSTVRNHLSHAFQRFGVCGQEDLVRLFRSPEEWVATRS